MEYESRSVSKQNYSYFETDMLSANDKAIPILYRVVLIVCVFLIFGVIMNVVLMKRDRIIEEKSHQTAIRIALIREEYERKYEDIRLKYKQTCEQTIQEIMFRIRQNAKEALEKRKAELQEFYVKQLTNQSDEIEHLKEKLKRISHSELNKDNEEKHLSMIADIEKHLSALKSKIFERLKAKDQLKIPGAAEEEERFSIDEEKVLSEVTKRLEELKKDLDKV